MEGLGYLKWRIMFMDIPTMTFSGMWICNDYDWIHFWYSEYWTDRYISVEYFIICTNLIYTPSS